MGKQGIHLPPGSHPLRNPKHEQYCLARVQGMSVMEAYGFVGYSTKSATGAYRLENHDEVKNRQSLLKTKKADEMIKQEVAHAAVDRADVIESIRDTRRKALEGVPVLNTKGSATGAMRVDLAQANKANELLGKTIGLFVDVTREETFDEELDGKTPEELREFVLSLLEQLDPNLRKMVAAELEMSAAPAEAESSVPDGETLQ